MTASRLELLESIRPGMKLDKNFFLRIFGYSMTTPEFAAEALERLKAAGCSKAHTYYEDIVKGYEDEYKEKIRPVAQEYAKELDRKWKQKEGEERREQRNSSGEKLKKNLNELLERENKLKQLLRKVQSQ